MLKSYYFFLVTLLFINISVIIFIVKNSNLFQSWGGKNERDINT